MATKNEIKNHSGFQSILEKARSLSPEDKAKLIRMFGNKDSLNFLSNVEKEVTSGVLQSKMGSKAEKFKGNMSEELNQNRDMITEILMEELK